MAVHCVWSFRVGVMVAFLGLWTVSAAGQMGAAPRALSSPVQGSAEEEAAQAAKPAPAENDSEASSDGVSSKSDKSAEEKKEAAKKAARLKKIKTLKFDRRPVTILAEWLKVQTRDARRRAGLDEQMEDEEPAEEQEADGEKKKREPDPFDEELRTFQQAVTLGDWPAVGQFLRQLGESERKIAYRQMLSALSGAPPKMPTGLSNLSAEQLATLVAAQASRRVSNRHVMTLADVFGIARAAPVKLDDEIVTQLGHLLRSALGQGSVLEGFIADLRREVATKNDSPLLDRRQAALLLMAAGEAIAAGEFLPTIKEAEQQKDRQGLNLLSRYYLALHQKEKKTDHLNQAWLVTQAIFALGAADNKEHQKERQEALERAVELAPKVREELGQTWLEKSFTADLQRGVEIIAAIGSAAASGLQRHATEADYRLRAIKLQTTAVEALLKAAPQRADQWRNMLDLLACNWLREATLSYQLDTSSRRGPRMQRDSFGNIFFIDDGGMGSSSSSRRLVPIKSAAMLENKPSEAWLQHVRPSMRPQFDSVIAQLHLKVNEEDEAFPYIEKLAKPYPEKAEELVRSFLTVWTRNHDPNVDRNRTNSYMFMYGFERRAQSIPLTRSKQERNLRDLAHWVARLRKLPIKKIDEKLLARAFTTCHSSAEVYRLEAIESVFGDIEQLDPRTLAELVQQMRANLMGVWRKPATQENKKTRRKQKDIEAEVLRGYRVARQVLENGLAKHPDQWTLHLAMAALDHDENNYRRDLAKSADYTVKRQQAFAAFERAAQLYARDLPKMSQDDITTQAFDLWFYASLGACDLQQVREDSVSDLEQPKLIRAAILALPEPYVEKHLAMFANALFTRISAVNPAVKFRYLKNGFTIVGDHEQAREARKIFDYYNDLVTEIRLRVALDGNDNVGHEKPFGVFVNIEHTREIERESGGFGKYLQNQNSGQRYYYNYGRPTENYRDKFEEVVRQALGEQFEVLSVTFQSDDVHSKALPEYGWRVTPYAYLLLKARGPEVDKIAPLRLDLDFLDTSGYVIIPVESQALPVEAATADGAARPIENLSVTQTLDERQADQGKLVLEIKATGRGLVPDLDTLVKLAPTEFDITEVDDEGLSVVQFDAESSKTAVVSQRSWLVAMKAKEELTELPKEFAFATVALPTSEVVYQRYVDADLVTVDQVVSLEQKYGSANHYAWLLPIGALGVLLVIGGIVWYRRTKRSEPIQKRRFAMPDQVTPFTVIGLLRNIESNNGLDDSGRAELLASIRQLERCYFAADECDQPDLERLARRWVERVES